MAYILDILCILVEFGLWVIKYDGICLKSLVLFTLCVTCITLSYTFSPTYNEFDIRFESLPINLRSNSAIKDPPERNTILPNIPEPRTPCAFIRHFNDLKKETMK